MSKTLFAILVVALMPLGGISTDIYLPSLPALTHDFHVSREFVQLTVTVFILGVGISQLIAGPVSDAVGRKKLIAFSLVLQVAMVLGIIFSPSMGAFIVFRFFQGVGVAFTLVPGRAIVTDVFSTDEAKKIFNYCTISFAVSPIVAPFLGGYFQEYYGWQTSFYFILAYAALFFLLTLFMLPETIAETKKFSLNHLWHNYRIVLQNKVFLITALFTGCTYGYAGLFNVSGPFLIQSEMHYSPISYGHFALYLGIAWFAGNFLNRFLFRFPINYRTLPVLIAMLLTAVIALIFTATGSFNVAAILVPTALLIFLSGQLFPMYVGEALTIFPELAASANGFLFSATWVSFAIATLISIALKSHSLAPISAAYLGVAVIMTLIFMFSLRKFYGRC